jgi:hypothetical protein
MHPATVVAIDPPACRTRWQREKPVHIREAVDAAIEQRNHHH